jgi:hypothetical protein
MANLAVQKTLLLIGELPRAKTIEESIYGIVLAFDYDRLTRREPIRRVIGDQ